MTTSAAITKEQAIARYPALAALAEITEAGWTFRPIFNEDSEFYALAGTRHVRQYTDALWIFDENSFLALRILEDEIDCGPVWKYDKGSIADAVSALLTLPEPGERLAPSLVLRSSGLWTPG